LGDVALSGISDDHVKKYREKRSGEKIIRHGNAAKKLVSQTTINKEVSTLRKFLRLARKKGFADKVTEFKMAPEKARKRILTDDEYKALLENSRHG
jgi:site-specific recombinase XerD